MERLLQGQCHEVDILFEGLIILIITLCVCTDGFQRSLKGFSLPYPIINFLCPFRSYFLLSDWSMFSCAASHWLQGKCARINLSQATSSMILQNRMRLPVSIFIFQITVLGSLKRTTGRICQKLVINFKRASFNFNIDFFTNEETKNCKNYQRTRTENTYLLL